MDEGLRLPTLPKDKPQESKTRITPIYDSDGLMLGTLALEKLEAPESKDQMQALADAADVLDALGAAVLLNATQAGRLIGMSAYRVTHIKSDGPPMADDTGRTSPHWYLGDVLRWMASRTPRTVTTTTLV